MNNQLILINLFKDRDNLKYRELVKDNILSEETKEVLKYVGLYYDNPTNTEISSWVDFGNWFLIKHPMYKSDKADMYKQIFSALDASVTPPEARAILEDFITRNAMAQIADHALRVAEGESDDIEPVFEATESLAKELGNIDDVDKFLVDDDIDALLDATVGVGGFDWRLDELNLSLGPLRKGSFINLIARPDSGKTTMLASEATFMAGQMKDEECIVWFNNEEEGRKVKLRCVQAALGMELKDIEADPRLAWQKYGSAIGGADRIKFYSRPTFSVRDVEEVLAKYNPSLIVFDQLRKVKGFNKEAHNDIGRMELLFQQAREWSKEYGPVINVHQAGGSAEGKQYIEMNEVYGSQTAIQGESDAIVTIGRTHEPGYEYSRFIYVPKNKMSGGPKSDESLRNGKFEVRINPKIARFE